MGCYHKPRIILVVAVLILVHGSPCPAANDTVVLNSSVNTVIWSYCTDYSTDSVVTIDIREADGITVVVEHTRRIAVFVRLSAARAFRNIRVVFTNVTFSIASSRWGYSGATQGLISLYSLNGPCEVSDVSIIFRSAVANHSVDDTGVADATTTGLLRNVVSVGGSNFTVSKVHNMSVMLFNTVLEGFSSVLSCMRTRVFNLSFDLVMSNISALARDSFILRDDFLVDVDAVTGFLVQFCGVLELRGVVVTISYSTFAGNLSAAARTGVEEAVMFRFWGAVSVHEVYPFSSNIPNISNINVTVVGAIAMVFGGYTVPAVNSRSQLAVAQPASSFVSVACGSSSDFCDSEWDASMLYIRVSDSSLVVIGKRRCGVVLFECVAVIESIVTIERTYIECESYSAPRSPTLVSPLIGAILATSVVATSSLHISGCHIVLRGTPGTVTGYTGTKEFDESTTFLQSVVGLGEFAPGFSSAVIFVGVLLNASVSLQKASVYVSQGNGTYCASPPVFFVYSAVIFVGYVVKDDVQCIPPYLRRRRPLLACLSSESRSFITVSHTNFDSTIGFDACRTANPFVPYAVLAIGVAVVGLGSNMALCNVTNLDVVIENVMLRAMWDVTSPLPQANGIVKQSSIVNHYDRHSVSGAALAPFADDPAVAAVIRATLENFLKGRVPPFATSSSNIVVRDVSFDVNLNAVSIAPGSYPARYLVMSAVIIAPSSVTACSITVVNVSLVRDTSVALLFFGSFDVPASVTSSNLFVERSYLNSITMCILDTENCTALLTNSAIHIADTAFVAPQASRNWNSFSSSMSSSLVVGSDSVVSFARNNVTGWGSLLWTSLNAAAGQLGNVLIDCGNRWRADAGSASEWLTVFPHAMAVAPRQAFHIGFVDFRCSVTQPYQEVASQGAGHGGAARAAAATALLGASLGGVATMAMIQSVAQSISLTARCQSLSDGIDDDEPPFSDIVDNPFGLSLFGAPAGGCIVGCVFSFALIVAGSVVKVFVQAVWDARGRVSAVILRQVAAHWQSSLPGCLMSPLMNVAEPLVAAALFLCVTSDRWVSGVAIGAVSLAVVAAALTFFVARVAGRPPSVVCLPAKTHGSKLALFFRTRWMWTGGTSAPGADFMRRYGSVIAPFRGGRQWYFAVDSAFSLSSSVINGVSSALPAAAVCGGSAVSLFTWLQSAVLVVQVLSCLALQPHASKLDSISLVVQCTMSLLVIWLTVAAVSSSTIDALMLVQTLIALIPVIIALVRLTALRWNQPTRRANPRVKFSLARPLLILPQATKSNVRLDILEGEARLRVLITCCCAKGDLLLVDGALGSLLAKENS